MAHEIDTTVNANGAAIYAKEPAWHGLGVLTPDSFTSADALNVAGLNFKVELHDTFTKLGDVYVPFPSKFTTVRMDTNAPLGIVGPGYTPLQTETLFKSCDEVLAEHGARYEAAGVLRGGARVWILARLPLSHPITGAKGDEIVEYLLWLTSHDGSSATWSLPTPTRVVCANTVALAVGGEKFLKARQMEKEGKALKVLHTANQEQRLKAARQMFLHAHEETLAVVEAARQLAEIPASPASREAVINHTIDTFVGSDVVILPDGTPKVVRGREKKIVKTTAELNSLIDAEIRLVGETEWALFSAATEFADHNLKYRGANAAENRFADIVSGRVAEFKEELVPVLVKARAA